MRKVLAVMMLAVMTVMSVGCASTGLSQTGQQGAGIGAVLGGVTGALLDHKNPWRGGVIGATAGAVTMGTIGELSARGAQEAAATGRPVEYRTQNGRNIYRATPMGNPDPVTKCRKVKETVWENGQVKKEQVKEVCEGVKVEAGY